MERIAIGSNRPYHGKQNIVVYRLARHDAGVDAAQAVFGARVSLLIQSDAFWPTFESGDNTGLIATDSMNNFVHRVTAHFTGHDLEGFCRFLGERLLATYPQVQGLQISATDIPYAPLPGGVGFSPSGPECATARLDMKPGTIVDVASGLRDVRLLRLGGSAFRGFLRDAYTTLPETADRPLHIGLTVEWRYRDLAHAFNSGSAVEQARTIVRDIFESFESESIQQLLHRMGQVLLERLPIAEVHLEATNHTWDAVATDGDCRVYTDSRTPAGCMGLTLRR